MKRKIYLNIAALSAIVAIGVTAFLLFTFYDFHVKSEIKALRDYGNIMSDILDPLDDNDLHSLKKSSNHNIRTTIIALDGKVLFDNIADPNTMKNHLDRPEVIDALKFGQGESIRSSTTLGKDTYYYALMLSNKSILRISRQGDNIFSHYMDLLSSIFMVLFLILLISFFAASMLTKKILEPIKNAVKNIEGHANSRELDEFIIYDEIMPLIKKVELQKEQISFNIKTLEEKATLMDVITSSMEEGLILIDKDMKILTANNSGIKLLEGNNAFQYCGEDFIKLSRNMILYEALEGSVNTKSSEELILSQGDKYLNIYINPVLRGNSLVSLVILIVDFTKKYKLDLMRREFSANVSHELKTPLTSINGYAEMIESGMAKDEDIKGFASTIRVEAARLLSLIDSIIKLSKIEENEYSQDFKPVDLYDIGKNTIDGLGFVAKEKNVDLNLYGKSTIIYGDESRLNELIYNLLDNGIKYTPPGGSVDLEIKNQDDFAVIRVIDTGIGISPDHQDRIFERFYIVDESRSKDNRSTGLGLSIVKHIVEHHNGLISLKSEIDKGTEIVVKIPKV